ncbi:MAG: dihydropteroate synthase [Bacteroidales bacterium]|nr:dihydropteroate synthase [Bacteroidales bacterium]
MSSDQVFNKRRFLNLQGIIFELNQPLIMGIINLTEDSFYADSQIRNNDHLLLMVEKMVNDGADIIDLGAQSTRPGAISITVEEELKRLIPAINLLKKHFPDLILSIDTFYAEVAEKTIEAGAALINDISGGTFDEAMFDVIAKHKIPYILMHTGGKPQWMQNNPTYKDVVAEVISFLSSQIEKLTSRGVYDIIVDPGFGFGKTIEHNYKLLNALSHLSFLERPILVGLSRKSMIYKPLITNPENVLSATAALHLFALQNGANILRVHDVKDAKEIITIFQLLKQNDLNT